MSLFNIIKNNYYNNQKVVILAQVYLNIIYIFKYIFKYVIYIYY